MQHRLSGLFFGLVAVVTLFLTACNSPITSVTTGTLSISLDNKVGSRTLSPSLDMTVADFAVTGTGPGGATFTATAASGTLTQNSLAFGSWTIAVSATNAAGSLVGTGTATADVTTGATTNVSITVAPVSGTGSLALAVSWPSAQVQTPSINASLTPALGSAQALPFTISGATASYSNSAIGDGYYTLGFTLQDGGITVAGAVEVVRIVTGQATSGTYNFTSVNAPGGAIQVSLSANMENPLIVAIAGASPTLGQGSTQTLSASVSNYSGNVVYVWHVNGVSAGTGPTFTFGTGTVVGFNYRIDVAAFSADGTQAGSATTNVGVVAGSAAPAVKRLAIGNIHSMAIKPDGGLWTFGLNQFGELGNGTVLQSNSPVKVMDGVVWVAAGAFCSAAVKDDGTLWTFGYDGDGQLGNGTLASGPEMGGGQLDPQQVMSGVAEVAVGSQHTLVLKTDGSLWAFGRNGAGQLGDGTTIDRPLPVHIMSDVTSISAGGSFSLVLKRDRTLWAFGNNFWGQLGDGSKVNSLVPILVLDNVVSMSAGLTHSLVLKSDGTLWGFGQSNHGELGASIGSSQATPIQIITDVASAYAGYYRSFVLRLDSTLWAFGENAGGELGDGTVYSGMANYQFTPKQVMAGVSDVATGAESTIVYKTDGSLWSFGLNSAGQLGDGTTTDRSTPVQVAGWPH